MVLKNLFAFLVLIITNTQFSAAQSAKLFFIKDKDTLSVGQAGIKVFLDVENKLIPFNNNESLEYPDAHKINFDSINSVVVTYRNDTLSFYNIKVLFKYSSLPANIIWLQKPSYSAVFADRRNMYFTIDGYPFENEDREDVAERNIEKSKLSLNKMTVVELHYQMTEIHAYEPKIK